MNPIDTDKQAAAEATKSKYLGVLMICGSFRVRYNKLVEELQNNFIKANSDYPSNTTEAYNLLLNYKTSYKPPTISVDD